MRWPQVSLPLTELTTILHIKPATISAIHLVIHSLFPERRCTKLTLFLQSLSLANAELYMCIPALLTRFDFEFFETDEWDIDMAVDSHHHSPRADTKGVYVLAKPSTY